MPRLSVSWNAAEEKLRAIAQNFGQTHQLVDDSEQVLLELGLAGENGLTQAGNDYYFARFVLEDEVATAQVLSSVLKAQPSVNAFCERLWGKGEIAVVGAKNLIKQIHHDTDETSASRWLELLNKGRILVHNRNNPRIRVLYNPSELVAPDEDAQRERAKAHVISPDTPYGNLLALRELIRAARGSIRWYEQHLPPKVLEVLYREVDGSKVSTIRLLSGPANITPNAKEEFKRFRKDMGGRSVTAEWRVLTRKAAQEIHGRFFISEGLARNVPPLNSILMGSTDEILPSEIRADDFDQWWMRGEDIATVTPGT